MNSRPLLPGQTPEMLPTPDAITFYDVVSTVAHDRVPAAGRLSYVRLVDGRTSRTADDWSRTALTPMIERVVRLVPAPAMGHGSRGASEADGRDVHDRLGRAPAAHRDGRDSSLVGREGLPGYERPFRDDAARRATGAVRWLRSA
jgi:hypothetical protein